MEVPPACTGSANWGWGRVERRKGRTPPHSTISRPRFNFSSTFCKPMIREIPLGTPSSLAVDLAKRSPHELLRCLACRAWGSISQLRPRTLISPW